MMLLHAAGLALFALAGGEKVIDYKTIRSWPRFSAPSREWVAASSATFFSRVPRVLPADIYAMAAPVGAVILIVIRRLGISTTLAAIAGGVCGFVLRVVAGYFHWNLPRISNPQ